MARLDIVADPGGSSLTMTPKSEYFDSANCTGTIVATETYSAPLTATYLSSGQAQVTGYPASNSVATYNVDRIQVAVPAGTFTVTGSGVSTINGEACITYTGGRTCLSSLTAPGRSITGGLFFTDLALVTLLATPAGYERADAYRRP
jgi:hypothetical protein